MPHKKIPCEHKTSFGRGNSLKKIVNFTNDFPVTMYKIQYEEEPMRFMLTFTWKQPPNEEVMALFPAERARAKELLEQGITEPAYVAADQSTFWAVWNCSNQDEVQKTLRTLPLYKFVNIDVMPLAEENLD